MPNKHGEVRGSVLQGVKVMSFIQNVHIVFGAHAASCSFGAVGSIDVRKLPSSKLEHTFMY